MTCAAGGETLLLRRPTCARWRPGPRPPRSPRNTSLDRDSRWLRAGSPCRRRRSTTMFALWVATMTWRRPFSFLRAGSTVSNRNRLSSSSSGWSMTGGARVFGLQQERQQHAYPLPSGEFVQAPVASIVHPKLQEVAVRAVKGGQLPSLRSSEAFAKGGLLRPASRRQRCRVLGFPPHHGSTCHSEEAHEHGPGGHPETYSSRSCCHR